MTSDGCGAYVELHDKPCGDVYGDNDALVSCDECHAKEALYWASYFGLRPGMTADEGHRKIMSFAAEPCRRERCAP
jgi:hypothetical protein